MLQRRIISVCTGLLLFIASHAQVNQQTGSATFSLPIFNWQDNKSRLNTLVALSYNSGNGLKVNEVSSNVGQGWSLVAGGVITRMQVGEPDDQKGYEGNGTETDIRKYPNGFLYSYSTDQDSRNGCPLALTRYPIYGSMNQLYKQHNNVASDKQMDYFSFQFNGKAGMFVLDPGRGDVGAFLGDTKMKVSFQRDENMANIRTTITSFTIQDVDGLIYRFKEHGSMEVLEENYTGADLKEKLKQPKFDANNVYHQRGFENASFVKPWVINSWYLSEIEDAFTHAKITFSYDLRSVNNIAGVDIAYDSWHDYSTVTHKTSITKTLEIRSIVMPDGHNVTFNYGSDRADLSGERALASVDITYQGRYLSKHQLTTSYFILNRYGTPVTDYQKKVARLCLLSVKKLGVDLKDDSPPYKFDYYTGSNNPDDVVPPAFSFAHDIWGFYNGTNSADNSFNSMSPLDGQFNPSNNQCKGLCFMRNNFTTPYLNAKDGYAKNGLLRQIIYPTGGTLTYQYQQNTGVPMNTSSSIVLGGVHVSQTSSTDGGYSNGCANPLVTHYNYVLENSSQSSMWAVEMPVNMDANTMHYEPEERKYKWTWRTAPAGSCVWTYQYPGILSQNQAVDLTSFQKTMDAIAPVLGVISTITTIVDIVSLACGSTGFLSWVSVIVDVVGGLITLGISCFSSNTKDGTSDTYHNSDLNATSPLPTQFKRVEVVEGSGANGRTVQVFTSDDDYGIWIDQNPHFVARQRFAPWAYGLPRFTTVYDASGNKLKETENLYDFDKAQNILGQSCFHCPPPATGIWSDVVSCKCSVERTASQRNSDWVKPSEYNANYQMNTVSGTLDVDFYPMYSGRTELEEAIERVYRKNDATQFVETHTTYQYNFETPNYEVKSITVRQSNGDYVTRNIAYSGDFTGGAFDVMNTNNMVSVPVSVQEYISKASGSSGYMSQKVTEFTQLSNGDIKPLQVLEERADRPSGWTYYGGPSNTDYSKFHVTQLFTYDGAGNLIGAKDEGNRLVANIYDYQDKYTVASVINADAVVDKPAYTSFETNVLGGWLLSGAANYVNNNGITGARVFNLAGSTLSAPLNTAKPYLLSFWANSSGVVVTGGATLTKSAPVINGFTYYEYEIAAGTGTVSVTGSAYIDELRLYPKNARMRTVTYDPLIGKTSECDENNRANYYEYDDLARLRFIKDENRNIVKMYEYNNVSIQNGCPGSYTNHQIIEIFTKSNCGSGYVGGDVTYTVPANKYTSAISQADADAQAEQEILTLGQQQADNAGAAQYCKMLYYNDPQSQPFTTQTCADGWEGGQVTYSVPGNKYTSLISKDDANQKALQEIASNGQANANDPANAICVADSRPIWEWTDDAVTYCTNINGQTPAHIMVLATDVNPNSSSYGHTSWQDGGVSDACPFAWYSTDQSGYYNSQNCPGGPSAAIPYYESMTAGSFGSDYSIDDANNQARQAAQNDANINGQCQTVTVGFDWYDSGTDYILVYFVNKSTGDTYYAFMNPSNTSGHLSMPSGYYDVTFSPSDDGYLHMYNLGCDYYKEIRETYTFENVRIGVDNMDCNLGVW